ncbi:MAG: glycosyltransferase family 4 protein [Planctomycetes bacterium]|nr:glycosyltransferase family 4 protein [Planctomycetota bacterium]
MRIVHFTGAFLPHVGGAEAVVHNLALEQTRMGHEAFVLNGWDRSKNAIRKYLPYRLLSLPPKCRIDELFNRPLRRMVLRAWLTYLQRRFRFDAWHLHYAYPVGSALPLLQAMGMEPVLTCHGIDVQTLPSIRYGVRLDPEIDREVTRVLCRCKKLVAIGSDMHREFLQAGCETARIFDIPNGVSLDRMNSISRDTAARKIRSRYQIPPEVPIILTVGRNHPKKGYDLIPAMIESLARTAQPFVWLIVGPRCESISERLAARGLAEHVRVVGSLGLSEKPGTKTFLFPSPEMVEMFRAADLFAFPTKLEAMGLVVLEAMAAGLPVVTTRVPGVRDLVESGVNGYLAREGDARDMAQYIRTLLLDPRLRQAMEAKGRQKAQEYDWPRIAQRYVDLYWRPCS